MFGPQSLTPSLHCAAVGDITVVVQIVLGDGSRVVEPITVALQPHHLRFDIPSDRSYDWVRQRVYPRAVVCMSPLNCFVHLQVLGVPFFAVTHTITFVTPTGSLSGDAQPRVCVPLVCLTSMCKL